MRSRLFAVCAVVFTAPACAGQDPPAPPAPSEATEAAGVLPTPAGAPDGSVHVPRFDREARGDLNGDGREDRAVIGTLEGPGNAYRSFLWVFVSGEDGERLLDSGPIGGKLWRSASGPRVTDGELRIETTSYGERDPSCCPTLPGVTYCEVDGGVICTDSDDLNRPYRLSVGEE